MHLTSFTNKKEKKKEKEKKNGNEYLSLSCLNILKENLYNLLCFYFGCLKVEKIYIYIMTIMSGGKVIWIRRVKIPSYSFQFLHVSWIIIRKKMVRPRYSLLRFAIKRCGMRKKKKNIYIYIYAYILLNKYKRSQSFVRPKSSKITLRSGYGGNNKVGKGSCYLKLDRKSL